ncbi:MAG: hypothetical protein O2789_03625, partial [Actinomycetota bacterium]|nr:hypothetical protein [Actinomycetota bacterium]
MVIAALGFGSMFILFTVVPIQAAESAGSLGAGLAMTVLMASTLATDAVMPALMRRVTTHTLLGASLWLMALPSIALMWDVGLPLLLVGTTVRGIGIGALIVVCTALVSLYAEEARQGAALGRYGLATSLAGMIAPPLGLAMLGVWTASPAALAVVA